MKPEAERAIRTIDELITWLASKRIVRNQAAINRLSEALKVIAINCEHDNAEHDAEMNKTVEKAHKYFLLLRACGLTTKGIIDLAEHDSDDIEDFVHRYLTDPDAKPLNFPLAVELFKLQVRVKKELSETDFNIINEWN